MALPAIERLTDEQVEAMVTRAYREAARCWAEARACQDRGENAAFLFDAAVSADDFYAACRDERDRRYATA